MKTRPEKWNKTKNKIDFVKEQEFKKIFGIFNLLLWLIYFKSLFLWKDKMKLITTGCRGVLIKKPSVSTEAFLDKCKRMSFFVNHLVFTINIFG